MHNKLLHLDIVILRYYLKIFCDVPIFQWNFCEIRFVMDMADLRWNHSDSESIRRKSFKDWGFSMFVCFAGLEISGVLDCAFGLIRSMEKSALMLNFFKAGNKMGFSSIIVSRHEILFILCWHSLRFLICKLSYRPFLMTLSITVWYPLKIQ